MDLGLGVHDVARIRRVVEADQVPDLVQGEHADVVGRERLPFGIEGGEGDDASGQVSVVVPLQVRLPGTLPFELDTPLDPHFGGTGVGIEVEPHGHSGLRHRWNALRTASRKAGWKLATVVGGKYTRTGVDTRLSQRCRMESVLAATISFKYVLPALARIRRRISERARSTM